MVTVTIPFAVPPAWASSSQNANIIENLTDMDSLALDYLESHPNASLIELSTKLGVGRTKCTKIIANLKVKGLLVNDGSTRKNEWRVIR